LRTCSPEITILSRDIGNVTVHFTNVSGANGNVNGGFATGTPVLETLPHAFTNVPLRIARVINRIGFLLPRLAMVPPKIATVSLKIASVSLEIASVSREIATVSPVR
jgi:hypothetical protein